MSAADARSGGWRLLRAEWTKLRSVPGWLIGLAAAAALIAAVGLLAAQATVCGRPSPDGRDLACTGTSGPGGETVVDRFYFLHRPMRGDGSLTVRLTDLRADQPWAKAGLIIKDGTRPGSTYAAIMRTAGHGVRLQFDFTHDVAGPPGAAPRWLRLTRDGGRVTGSVSRDGRRFQVVGSATLPELPQTAQVGLFAAAPHGNTATRSLTQSTDHPTAAVATATFDRIAAAGGATGTGWDGADVGTDGLLPTRAGGFDRDGGVVTLRGSGDIAPAVSANQPVTPIERTLLGTIAGLIAIAVVAIAVGTAEYRHRTVRLTFAASPRRVPVLAARAVVLGATVFVAGSAGAALAVVAGSRLLRGNGNVLVAVPTGTELRVVVGTAALLAAAAVFALAVATIVRRGVGAIAVVVLTLVLPYLLGAAVPMLPGPAADWLLRVTPAAGFAIQQTVVRYPQVAADYAAAAGYFPLPPWAGLAVSGGYALVALAVAGLVLRRRDA